MQPALLDMPFTSFHGGQFTLSQAPVESDSCSVMDLPKKPQVAGVRMSKRRPSDTNASRAFAFGHDEVGHLHVTAWGVSHRFC